jgi:hypothetical protein
VSLDLAIGLKLHEARNHPVIQRDEGGGPCGALRAVGALGILAVGIPPLGADQRDEPSRCSRSNALTSVSDIYP